MTAIAIDARMAGHPGIGRYMRSLTAALLKLDTPHRFILVGRPEELKEFGNEKRAEIRPCTVPIYGFAEQVGMGRYFAGADLVHVPHFNAPVLGGEKLVVTIHDLIYFHVPEYQPFPGARFALQAVMAGVTRRACRVIAVSQATSNELSARFSGLDGKLRVIHEAAAPYFAENTGDTDDVRSQFGLARPFVLSVGSVREHKNVQGLLAAFEKLLEGGKTDADLVICGRLDERFDKKHRFRERIAKTDRIRYLGPVDDAALKGLYAQAACFVMPSFYEGFGLPVIEAMAAGAPVIASSAASLPEIVGSAGLTFDPGQIDQLQRLLYNVLSDKGLQQNLSAKASRRAREFSWEKTAKLTLDVYQEALI